MSDDFDFFSRRSVDKTYLSKAFKYNNEGPKMRVAHKAFGSPESHTFIRIKDEIVLQISHQDKFEVKAYFYEDSRKIHSLTIQRFTKKSGQPHQSSFTFVGDDLQKLLNLIRIIKQIHLDGNAKVKLDDDILEDLLISSKAKQKFIQNNQDIVIDIAKHKVTTTDIIALGYRKKQLEIFNQLLQSDDFFRQKQNEWRKRGKEAVWQQFFEANPWIFGYGLNYIFTSSLTNKKLEQVTSGYSISQSGKRVDALMKTQGLISSLCFAEIKTHKTPLLFEDKSYRAESWRISDELSGSIAQIQKTVQKAIQDISSQLSVNDEYGNPTGEIAFLYQPKSFLVIGSLAEFRTDHGVNEEKYGMSEFFSYGHLS